MTTQSPSSKPSPRNIDLVVGTVTVNLSCVGFHMWAEDFLNAERLYAPTARPGSFVAHFLCCQSIELSLKAYLSLRGASRKDLKKPYGHNLVRLFRDAYQKGIDQLVALLPSDTNTIADANGWYDTHGGKRFQYFDVMDAVLAFKHAPELAPLEDLAARLQTPLLRETLLRES
jgi:hypothetical protein